MSKMKVYEVDKFKVDLYRKILNITQKQLGEYCGLTYQAIQKKKWNAFTIVKACELLKCEPSDILIDEVNIDKITIEVVPCIFINGKFYKKA